MDRQTVYPGQILPETTLLQMAKDSMIGVAKLSAAMLGTSTIANGFATTATAPASLQVVVAAGELYALTTIDGTAWSSLAADTTHSIMKQGISLDSTTLTCAAPTTTGQSINYLVEVAYQDLDATPVLLPYYNSANPSQPYSGQGNNGLTQNTTRKGSVIVQVKAGASAATGSQTTPSPDSGYVGLYVVTVAYAQTTITSANISRYSAAPLLPAGLVQSIQAGAMTYSAGTGAANAYSASYAPAITALTDGMTLHSTAVAANTGASTFSPNGLTAKPILSLAQNALTGGELALNGRFSMRYSATLDSWILISSSGGNLMSKLVIKRQVITSTGTYTPSAGLLYADVEALGAGGGGGGVAGLGSSSGGGGGGGAGGYARKIFTASQIGASQACSVGSAGTAGVAGNNSGGVGGPTSLGALLTAPGGGGGSGSTASSSIGINAAGAQGGAPTGGDINARGANGSPSFVFGSTSGGLSGAGGNSQYGAGGYPSSTTGTSNPGTGYGAGGSGGFTNTTTNAVGAAGSQGILIITEYCTQ